MPEIFTNETNHPKDVATHKEKHGGRHTVYSGVHRGRHSMLSAFMVRPEGVRFETQNAKEQIILLMRRHHITNVGWLFITFLLLITPTFLFPLVFTSSNLLFPVPPGYIIVAPFLWYLFTFGFALSNFLHWYFNVYIVTSHRVVDIDWYSLLYKQLSSTDLDKIQDVTYKQGGILDSFFDFGTVLVQTAGTEPNFEFEEVPQPEHVVRQINEIVGENKK